MKGIYLYGVIDSEEEASLGIPGLDGTSSLYTIGHLGIGCVVSEYTGEAISALPREKLVRCLLRYQEAIEHVMRRHVVLPVKFGTVLGSVHEVRALLKQAHNQLANALMGARDKVEIDVAATWDTASILREIGQEEAVARVRERITRNGPPTVTQQVQLGQVVKAAMDTRRSTYRDRMVASLGPVAVDLVANPLMSDEMVMNVAFLVALSRQGEFDAAVQGLDGLFQNEITFRVIGPLPPHSFATLEVKHLSPSDLEGALRVLQLQAPISKGVIRKAYRRLAAQAQGGPIPGDVADVPTLERLRQASDLLLDYCQARQGRSPGEGNHVPAEDDGSGLFGVTLRRSEGFEIEPSRFGSSGGYGKG